MLGNPPDTESTNKGTPCGTKKLTRLFAFALCSGLKVCLGRLRSNSMTCEVGIGQ
ncbi:unnamed protein product [Penicillium salamii]|nr:unnamed protein product [Penicillium salamii]